MSTRITIALTNARPISVTSALWPIVAKGTEDRDHNNQELFRRYYIRVRQHGAKAQEGTLAYYGGDKDGALTLRPHRDGRCIVTARYSTSWQGEADKHAAYICTLDEVADKVREAGEEIGAPEDVIWDCLSELPPVEIEELEDWTDEELKAELETRKVA